MKHAVDYLVRLGRALGNGWTRFWFIPSDPATLAAIRVLTGVIVVYLHATLLVDLVTFFGPDGLLPVPEVRALSGNQFSYLNYLRTPVELWTVQLLGLAVLVAMTLGLWTRTACVLSLIVFLSDVHRAPMLTARTESVCAMLLLYLCVGPAGARFSLDRWLARRSGKHIAPPVRPATTATIATRLIQVHLALLVAMMAFSQLAGDVWWDGSGVWWLIARPNSTMVELTWLSAQPTLVEAWTHAIVLFELAFAVLVWVPIARPLLLVLGALIWTSLAVLTGELTFAPAMITASLAFIQPDWFLSLADSRGRA